MFFIKAKLYVFHQMSCYCKTWCFGSVGLVQNIFLNTLVNIQKYPKTLVNSFLNHFGFNSTSLLFQLDGKTYPWPKTTPCAKDFFNTFNSNDFNIFSIFTKDFQLGYH